MSAETAPTSIDAVAAASDTLTDTLRQLGHDALESAPNDAERLDGLRFILRQLAAAATGVSI